MGWPVPMGLLCLRLTMLMVLSVLQLLLDKPTIAMLLEPQWLRTALNMESLDTGLFRPDLLLPQPSLRPQLLMLPSPLPLSQLDLLLLTLLSRPRSLLPSEPTPESPLRSPTLSHKLMSRNTTLMSLLLSHVLFPVRSSRSLMSLSLMRFPSHVPSQSQLPTRFTPSRKSLRLPTSTTLHTRPTPARLL